MNIKRNIIFAPESRKKDGIPVTKNVPIRMRVIFASQRIEFTTGYRIDVEKWDTDKQRVRNGCTNKLKQSASEINAELLRQYTEIQNVFKEFEVQDVIPTPAQIKEAFNLKTKGEKKENHEEKQKVELDFMKVFNEFVAECSKQNDWSSSTLKKFATVKKHIYLKSATKLFSVLLASKRPLITELADKLRLKYPLLPTISPCPTMRLEAIRSIIPISCRRYPKSV